MPSVCFLLFCRRYNIRQHWNRDARTVIAHMDDGHDGRRQVETRSDVLAGQHFVFDRNEFVWTPRTPHGKVRRSSGLDYLELKFSFFICDTSGPNDVSGKRAGSKGSLKCGDLMVLTRFCIHTLGRLGWIIGASTGRACQAQARPAGCEIFL